MEAVRDVDQRPASPKKPLVCLDESRQHQVIETRQRLPAEPGDPERSDDEDERHGVSNRLMIFAPVEGWRPVAVTARRTKGEWAHGRKDVLTGHFPEAENVTIGQDNLHTPHPSSLSEACAPEEAQAWLARCELH